MGNRSAKQIIKILKKSGFIIVSQKGSHKKLKKGELTVIVPDHGSKDLSFGLIKALEKATKIKLV